MYDATHKTIAKRIEDGYGNTSAIMAENLDTKKPTDAPWVRWSVRPATLNGVDCTGLRERGLGVVYFQIFTPEQKGSRLAFAITKKLAQIFNAITVESGDGGSIIFRRVNGPIAAGKSEGWLQQIATLQYQEENDSINAT
jgi:hypothetical protein